MAWYTRKTLTVKWNRPRIRSQLGFNVTNWKNYKCLACLITAASLTLCHPQHAWNKAVPQPVKLLENRTTSKAAALFLSHTHPRGPPSLFLLIFWWVFLSPLILIRHQFRPSAFQPVGSARSFTSTPLFSLTQQTSLWLLNKVRLQVVVSREIYALFNSHPSPREECVKQWHSRDDQQITCCFVLLSTGYTGHKSDCDELCWHRYHHSIFCTAGRRR